MLKKYKFQFFYVKNIHGDKKGNIHTQWCGVGRGGGFF